MTATYADTVKRVEQTAKQLQDRKEAIEIGIRTSHKVLSDLERRGIASLVSQLAGVLEACDVGEEHVLLFMTFAAESIAGTVLLPRLLAGWEAEWKLREDDPLEDGLVGQAIDKALAVLEPYTR